ncbi:DNA glycosylase AlkZ-like family protein [Demequina muriae]|uniref:Crosslink repair DNA glycosylase YcaQ family protein n=1 Tax=Demequina muriae TaxID=3051664 RepID=A0ABT8GIF0_9MICO|nr:crosslink repair DNA glycosylase YcaQ family protein [Demequina sp. EGI L300058]MDN4481195.1 crosslink repair DNA glycosylase YcaQ family protein [Demequina sp. EGI L300058]
MTITREQALSWRLGRHFLTTPAESAVAVVDRLGAVPAISGDPDLAIRARLGSSEPGVAALARREGELMLTYAYRGATHLMTPRTAGVAMALRASSRMWERASWVSYYGLEPADWPDLRAAVREALAAGPLSRDEIATEVTRIARFSHLRPAFMKPDDAFLKPFAWQGDMCFGPGRDGVVTYQRPDALAGWEGLPPLEVAGPAAVMAYLGAYGPAHVSRLHYWLGEGLGAAKRSIAAWVAGLDAELVTVEVDGEPMLCAGEHVGELRSHHGDTSVVLLPGYDQWVLGPGTADPVVVPPERRQAVTRGASVVLHSGRVAGTWRAERDSLAVVWFPEAGDIPRAELGAATRRLGSLLGRDFAVDLDAS